jgi:hypothetical protein
MKRRLLTALLACLIVLPAAAQPGAISGTVYDDVKEPLIGAAIVISAHGETRGRTVTDIDGRYTIKNLTPGSNYLITVSFPSFKAIKLTKVRVTPERTTYQNFQMELNAATLDEVVVKAYRVPIIKKDEPGSTMTITSETIEKLATRSSSDMASTAMSAYHPGSDGAISIAGARTAGTSYIVDEGGGHPEAYSPGRLTSGEVNDFHKWHLWRDLSDKELKHWKDLWNIIPKERYTLQLSTGTGNVVVNAVVQLKDRKTERVVWQARTDNTGKAELWNNIFGQQGDRAKMDILIHYEGKQYSIRNVKTFYKGINELIIPAACSQDKAVDIAFIVDATSSMQDEINYLKAELTDIIGRVKDSMPGLDVYTAGIFYRDLADDYVTLVSPFTNDVKNTLDFINRNNSGGGGDTPEAVDSALEAGLSGLEWRTSAMKLAFLVLDAPPHDDPKSIGKIQELTLKYAQQGIRLIVVACSGIDKGTEYLMRSLALATNGTYLFLTSNSGIGDSHIEPSTDKYEVKYMNKAIADIIFNFTFIPSCEQIAPATADTNLLTTGIESNNDSVAKHTTVLPRISWKYYPNPSRGSIYIEHDKSNGHLYISDISGKLIMRTAADKSGKTKISMEGYPAGFYFIKYEYEPDKWLSGKFNLLY